MTCTPPSNGYVSHLFVIVSYWLCWELPITTTLPLVLMGAAHYHHILLLTLLGVAQYNHSRATEIDFTESCLLSVARPETPDEPRIQH